MSQLSGKCHCGKCSYEFTGEVEFQFVCYCNSCRTLNGGGHLCGIMVDANNLNTCPDAKQYKYTGGTGSDIDMFFCPNCATTLYGYPRAYEGKVVLRANAIADFDFKPVQNLFASEAFAWDRVEEK